MKTKNIILCGVSLITSSLLGSPFGADIDEMLDRVYESFSNLNVNLNEKSINIACQQLKNVLTELEKLEKNVNNCEVEYQIIGIKGNLEFLNDLNQYMNNFTLKSKKRLEQWADTNFKFVPIVQEAFKQKGVVIY